jgi:hypothetical protein
MSFAMGRGGRLARNGPDTIYLLSDGMPNSGNFTRPNDILREVKRLNRVLRMTVHTVWIDQSRDPAKKTVSSGATFMKRLASEKGGRFVSIAGKQNRSDPGCVLYGREGPCILPPADHPSRAAGR